MGVFSTIKSLRRFDMFGHLITMNFNKRGNHHKTLIGAIFSIFIKLLIYVYVALTFKSLIFKTSNKNTTIYSSEPIESLGKINRNESGHFTFYEMRN